MEDNGKDCGEVLGKMEYATQFLYGQMQSQYMCIKALANWLNIITEDLMKHNARLPSDENSNDGSSGGQSGKNHRQRCQKQQ